MRSSLLKPRFRRALGLAVLNIHAGLCAGEALGVDRSWTNGAGGTFTVASNWTGGTVPGAIDRAFFSLDDPGYTVTFVASVATDELHVPNDNVTFNLVGTRTYTLNDAAISAIIGSGGGRGLLELGSGTLLCTGGARVGDGTGSIGRVTVDAGILSTAGVGSQSLIVGSLGDGGVAVLAG